jgi:hypothetical protein
MQPHIYGHPLAGLIGRIDNKPYFLPEMPNYSKIIFLNKTNLEEFEGYKASIELYGGLSGKQEIHIILTGFSFESAKTLFDKLIALPKNEVYSNQTVGTETSELTRK